MRGSSQNDRNASSTLSKDSMSLLRPTVCSTSRILGEGRNSFRLPPRFLCETQFLTSAPTPKLSIRVMRPQSNSNNCRPCSSSFSKQSRNSSIESAVKRSPNSSKVIGPTLCSATIRDIFSNSRRRANEHILLGFVVRVDDFSRPLARWIRGGSEAKVASLCHDRGPPPLAPITLLAAGALISTIKPGDGQRSVVSVFRVDGLVVQSH